MKTPADYRPFAVVLLAVLNTVMGLVSLYYGTVLMADSSGASLALSNRLLDGLPITDFRSIGVFLVVIGLAFVLSSVGLWRNYGWGWPMALGAGVVMAIGTTLSLTLAGLHFALQPLVLLAVIWEIYLLFRPRTVSYTLL